MTVRKVHRFVVPVGILLCISLGHSHGVYAASFSGEVDGVIDGDSIRVMHNGRAEEVRFTGIDCPEKGQAYGNKGSKPPQPW